MPRQSNYSCYVAGTAIPYRFLNTETIKKMLTIFIGGGARRGPAGSTAPLVDRFTARNEPIKSAFIREFN